MASFLDTKGRRTPYGEFPEVSTEAWPEPHWTARKNDPVGESIVAFIAKWRGDPRLAAGPWDNRTGTINLVPPNQPRPARDPTPRYRTRDFGAVGASVYAAGSELDLPSYPKNPSLLEPMNESAERVLDYMARVGPGRTLLGMAHENGILNLPSPASFGIPQNAMHRGTFGEPQSAA